MYSGTVQVLEGRQSGKHNPGLRIPARKGMSAVTQALHSSKELLGE